MNTYHQPVLLKEALDFLVVKSGRKYIDATVGGGGHSEAILQLGGQVLGIDQDPEAIKAARRRFAFACPAFWRLAQGNFRELKRLAEANGFEQVAGVLFDLGVSTHQLETPGRGFSFRLAGPLDMRMKPGLKVTAADLINGLNTGELDELFKKLAGEHHSRRIAEAICRARLKEPIRTTGQLAEVIVNAGPREGRWRRIHPATKCFQALRIAVNDELNSLREALAQAQDLLEKGGRLVVISFHSGEDKIVKDFMRENSFLRVLTRKPLRPTAAEVAINPRSGSACLRGGEKR